MPDYSLIGEPHSDDFKRILDLINLHKNGVVTDSMKRVGLVYTVNYGVSIVDLRRIAKRFKSDNVLANLLWEQGWRETYIVASLIAEPETMAMQNLIRWIEAIPNFEIAEQLGNNLLWRIKYGAIIEYCLQSKNNLIRMAGYKALAKTFLLGRLECKELFLNSLTEELLNPELNRRPMAIALGQAGAFLIRFDNNLINWLTDKFLYFATVAEDFKLAHQYILTEIEGIGEKKRPA